MNPHRSQTRASSPTSQKTMSYSQRLIDTVERAISGEKWSEAIDALRELTRLHPEAVGVFLKLALVYQHLGQIPEAIATYRDVLVLDDQHLIARNNLGNLLVQLQNYPEAVDCLMVAKDHPEAGDSVHFNLAHACSRNGDAERARRCYETLLQRAPDSPKYRWGQLYSTPVVYRDIEQIRRVRVEWLETIVQLKEMACNTVDTKPWSDNVLASFYLHYACEDDLKIQRAYGDTLDTIAGHVIPELRMPLRRRSTAGRRIRVGVVSANFNLHTVSKLFRGWFEHIDSDRFELFGVHVGERVDAHTDTMASHFSRWVHRTGPWQDTAKEVRAMELDVVLFPEVGMDAEVIKLATTRMAPLQCMAWGHPVTSGLDNIDVFLSSEWMEPRDGQQHVFERLVALPKLGIYYTRPDTPSPSAIREELGLGDEVLFFCGQSLQKLLPNEDDIWPQIASALPLAKICFIQLPGSHSTRVFQERLSRAFAARGLQWQEHCVLLPRLTPEQFKRLSGSADVYLDSPSWSGGNTSLEAMAYGVPMVSKEGPLMRQRHTAAMLKGIGLERWVAKDHAEFVSLAVTLGRDAALRDKVRAQIQARSHILFHQTECIRALESFLENEVGRTAPQRLDLLVEP